MNRNLLKALGLSVLMMSRDREAPAGGGTVPAPAGDAAKTAGAPAAEKAKAEPKPYVSPVVVGGRMNLVFVHLIRNVEAKDAAVADTVASAVQSLSAAGSKGVIHKRQASRRISRLMKAAHAAKA